MSQLYKYNYLSGCSIINDLLKSDLQLLLNPAWESLQDLQKDLGTHHGAASIYDMQVSPFGAVRDASEEAMQDLACLCSPGRVVLVMFKDHPLAVLDAFELVESSEVLQMVHTGIHPHLEFDGIPLSNNHVEQMRQLVKLTNPGPFGKRTIEMGNYCGIEEAGRLLAMAGERFKPSGWVEISGVCSHPDGRGKGYAAGLVSYLLSAIKNRSQQAFLHVRVGSPSEKTAVGVYERLGFEYHQTMKIGVLRRI